MSSVFVILAFNCAHLKFTVYGSKQANIHTHAQCSPASVTLYGVPYVSKLKNKKGIYISSTEIQIQCRIFKSSQVYIYIHHRIYISSQGFICPATDLYIQPGIHISSQEFIYPVRDLYIQHRIYISSTGYIHVPHGIYKSSQGFTIYGHRI